ncbi:MAG: hypothetical protein ACETVR_02625 [Candidatus Bathyarchaeia archaeon]
MPRGFQWKILKRALFMGVLFTLLDIAIAFNVWTKGDYIFGDSSNRKGSGLKPMFKGLCTLEYV